MASERLDGGLKPGDVVALRKFVGYGAALGVVRTVTTRGIRVDFCDDETSLYSGATGASRNARLAEAGYRIVPLDAATRKDILRVGFAFGKCSRPKLEEMERQARLLRDDILGTASAPPGPDGDAVPAALRP